MENTKPKKEIVNFIQERTFGDLIGVPFQFIIQEFKTFSGTLLKFAGPFVAIMFLAVTLLANDIYTDVLLKTNTSGNTIGIYVFILIFAVMLGMLAVITVTHSYITLYINQGKGNFTKEDVGILLKKNVWKVFGAGILIYIMVIFGFLLLYIPGIWLAITFSFVFLIIIYEDVTVGKSISRSFDVIKNYWWQTFGLILVFGLIIGTMSYVFIIPIYALVIVAAIGGTQIGTGSVIFIAVFVFLYFTAYMFFMSMQQILAATQYFNIKTRKEGLLLQTRIDAINNKNFEMQNSENQKNDSIKTKNTSALNKDGQNRFTKTDDFNRFKPKK